MSSALMSIGKSAMTANYAALQTVSNNIANANTPGYSRQEAQLADAPGQFTGSGFFGKGVTVTTVQRAYSSYLTSQAVGTSSTAAADSARLDKLTQLETVFPLGDAGLGANAGAFLNSYVDLSNAPSDASARQVVLSQAQSLASQFAAAGNQLSALQAGVAQDVRTSVASLNTLAQQVAALNQQIAALQGAGQPPNQLLDQRDQLVSQIAGMVNVTTIPADDGSVGVFIGGGQSLVLGANATTVKAVPDAFDPTKVSLALAEGSTSRLIPPASLAGGTLAGLLKFQNDDLTSAQNLLGQMATAVSGAVNGQQALGLDLGQPPGAGAPIFSVGAPIVQPANTNTGNAALSVSVADPSQVLPTGYAVTFDGSNYVVSRTDTQAAVAGSPFTPAQLAAGVQFNGVSLKLTGGSAAASDRFLLQPVANAASTMQMVLGGTQGLAAAAPFTASTGVANTGSATIASLTAVNPSYNGTLSAAISFTSNTGDYSWTLSDGSSGTGTWTAGSPIALNGFELQLAGVPKSGDTLSVQPTTDVASNNGNALAFVNLADRGVVASGDGTPAQSVTDAYASAIASVGVRVQSGKTASQISTAAASQAESARSDNSGVNLDEEAAKLIQYQQSYQAAAKILQVAQQIFDTMLQTATATT